MISIETTPGIIYLFVTIRNVETDTYWNKDLNTFQGLDLENMSFDATSFALFTSEGPDGFYNVEFPLQIVNAGAYEYTAYTLANGTGGVATINEWVPTGISGTVTVANTISGSLSTIDDANSYFAKKLHVGAWTDALTDTKQKALNEATQIIDRFNYVGHKTEADQDHEWPRSHVKIRRLRLDETVIPNDILFAQYEIALALLNGIDPEREIRNARVTSRGYSSVRTTYDPRSIPEHTTFGVPSALAWSYLSTYLDRGSRGIIRLHRVN